MKGEKVTLMHKKGLPQTAVAETQEPLMIESDKEEDDEEDDDDEEPGEDEYGSAGYIEDRLLTCCQQICR